MTKFILTSAITVLFLACKSKSVLGLEANQKSDFTLTFGSCNKHDLNNRLWDDITSLKPDVWVWGGDIIYADTDNMDSLRDVYGAQNAVEGYMKMKQSVPIIGCWDDHDYGLNDGGVEFSAKKGSQQQFLDFMDVPRNSPRRNQEGIYTAHDYKRPEGHIKVIVLDTRYFRTAITPDTETDKRLKPNAYGNGTILGEAQWKWLEGQLRNSTADFNIIVSSIQVLSDEHGFECWGNFPHEVDKLKQMIIRSKAKGVLILSGDRHISEFSKATIDGLDYPIIDFTSSGLTHAYSKYKGEPNPYRVGEVVKTESFGLLEFDFGTKVIDFKMIGNSGAVLGELQQSYE